MEAFPAVVSTDGITLVVPDMIVCGYENPDSLRIYRISVSDSKL